MEKSLYLLKFANIGATSSSESINTPIFISNFIVPFQFFTTDTRLWLLQVYTSNGLTFLVNLWYFKKLEICFRFCKKQIPFSFLGSVVVKLGGAWPHPKEYLPNKRPHVKYHGALSKPWWYQTTILIFCFVLETLKDSGRKNLLTEQKVYMGEFWPR